MRHTAKFKLVLCAAFVLTISLSESDARGGRRGGGSIGGLFGGWRKYKKPSSGVGSSRRTILNNSPTRTTITKTTSPFGSSSSPKKTHSRVSYPRQSTHTAAGAGYYPHGGYHNVNGGGHTYVPPGGTYYANTAAIPPGAVYYAQPPVHSSGGNGDFLMGMVTGHMLFGHHHSHIHHIHRENQQQQSTESGSRVIIIDNNAENSKNYWPTETDVPLAPLNSTLTPVDATPVDNAAVFPRLATQNINTPNVMQSLATSLPSPTSANTAATAATNAPPQAGGIICVPMLFNLTDPNDASETVTVKKMVCYPAPPPSPPPTAALPAGGANCITRRFIETDPNDSTKTIEVERPDCSVAAQATPAQIIGEIGESMATDEPVSKQPSMTSTTGAASKHAVTQLAAIDAA